MINKVVLHYKILEKLGEGGMGVVYKAEDTKLLRKVALKFLPPALTSDNKAKERFIREARAASALDHPNVCTIHEINETKDGQMFLSMACYEGMNLQEKIGNKPIPIKEVIDITTQIALGLAKAHQQSIIHQDMKPANIFITEDGLVKILDFGIAKLIKDSGTDQDTLNVGTVAHMSPEQINGDNVDNRTDIWSLGVIMYEMITGKLPFEGEYNQAIIYSILNEDPVPPGKTRKELSMELQAIVLKALSKNPDDRFQNVEELLENLNDSIDPNTTVDNKNENINESSKQRKLSAIMFTDMVGYSALTQENEALAIELLEVHRQLLRPIFKKHRGKEIENTGDAFFVEFYSALEAVHCAIEIQKMLFERNKKVEGKRQILLRIGLHVGDVVHIGEHVHGDGVNIAARLEPLSTAGGICISEDVARQIHNKIDLPLTKLGIKHLKNIKNPIEIYSIELPWENIEKRSTKNIFPRLATKRTIIPLIVIIITFLAVLLVKNTVDNSFSGPKNNRIAVLPIINISENPEDNYFADGMTEELISQLAKISGLNVIARTSVMKYKNVAMNIEEIGNELDVATILEGSVRKSSDKTRISVQLIDVYSQENLWSQEYDRKLKDIFAVQSDIALNIANELKIQLLNAEKQQIEKRGTENPEAYSSYLLGKYQLNQRTPESLYNGIEFFNKAIDHDQDFALAYVGLADCYTLIAGAAFGYLPREEAIQEANDAINTAIEIDPTLAQAYNSLAYLKFRLEWNWEDAEVYFKKAIDLQPGYASSYEKYALLKACLGRYEEAISLMEKAYKLDPLSPSVSTGVGRMYHFAGDYKKAISHFKKTIKMFPDYAEAEFAIGLSYTQNRMYSEAIAHLKKAIDLSSGRLVIIAALGAAYANAGMIKEALGIKEELRELQLQKEVSPYYFAVIDAPLGNKEAAIDSLFKAYHEHFGILVYLTASPMMDNLIGEGRYEELLKTIGLEE